MSISSSELLRNTPVLNVLHEFTANVNSHHCNHTAFLENLILQSQNYSLHSFFFLFRMIVYHFPMQYKHSKCLLLSSPGKQMWTWPIFVTSEAHLCLFFYLFLMNPHASWGQSASVHCLVLDYLFYSFYQELLQGSVYNCELISYNIKRAWIEMH